MPVYKDKKRDTWYIAINYIDPLTNKYKKKFKRGFSTKKEAQLAEAKLLQDNVFKSDSTTFRMVLDMYLDHTEASPSTRHMKTAWISNYFQYIDTPIERTTKPILVEWRNSLNKTNLATRTKNRGMQYVKGVFTFYSDLYGGSDNGKILKSFKLQKKIKKKWKYGLQRNSNNLLNMLNYLYIKRFIHSCFGLDAEEVKHSLYVKMI